MVRTEVMCSSCGGHLGHRLPGRPASDGRALLHQLRSPETRGGLKLRLFQRHKTELVDAADALPGRDATMPLPERHDVLGTPLTPPFPEGYEQLVVGMGCFWGAERIFWQAPGRLHDRRRLRGRPHAEPDVRGGVQRPHGTHRGRAGRLGPGPHRRARRFFASSGRGTTPRRACARATTSARSTARPSTSRTRSSGRPRRRLATCTSASSRPPATARSPRRSPTQGRSTTPSRTTSSTWPRTRTATAAWAEPALLPRRSRDVLAVCRLALPERCAR